MARTRLDGMSGGCADEAQTLSPQGNTKKGVLQVIALYTFNKYRVQHIFLFEAIVLLFFRIIVFPTILYPFHIHVHILMPLMTLYRLRYY